jgi:hypothetical protein
MHGERCSVEDGIKQESGKKNKLSGLGGISLANPPEAFGIDSLIEYDPK